MLLKVFFKDYTIIERPVNHEVISKDLKFDGKIDFAVLEEIDEYFHMRKVILHKEMLVNNFLKQEAFKLLANDPTYIEENKKFQLLCSAYGFNEISSLVGGGGDLIFDFGGYWHDDSKFDSSYKDFICSYSDECRIFSYAEDSYKAERRVAEWKKEKASLENKLARAKKQFQN